MYGPGFDDDDKQAEQALEQARRDYLAELKSEAVLAREALRLEREQLAESIVLHYVITPNAPSEKLRKNPAFLASVVAALIALTGTGITVASQVSTQQPPDCAALTQKYEALVDGSPNVLAALIEPGPNGKSVLSSDENASECSIDETTLKRLAGP